MKRLAATSLSIVLAVVCLSGCRAPVSSSGYRPLDVCVSLPADLTSSVPATIRKAIAEDLFSRPGAAASRFIHPNASYAVATITGPDVDLSTEPVTLSAGSSAELSFRAVPARSGLTLTVRVYDADGAIVGERVVDDLELEAGGAADLSVGIVPYEAETLTLGTLVESGYSEPVLSLDSIEDRLYVYAVELPTRGLYNVKLGVDYVTYVDDQPVMLYDEDGLDVGDYVDDDPSRSGFGLFTNDAPGPARHYLAFYGNPSWAGVDVSVHRECEASMAIIGRLTEDPEGMALIYTTNGAYLGNISSISEGAYEERSFLLKNLSGDEMRIASCAFESGSSDSFSLPKPPATTIPPGGTSEFIVRFEPTSGGDFDATLLIDSDDDADIDLSMSFSGAASA